MRIPAPSPLRPPLPTLAAAALALCFPAHAQAQQCSSLAPKVQNPLDFMLWQAESQKPPLKPKEKRVLAGISFSTGIQGTPLQDEVQAVGAPLKLVPAKSQPSFDPNQQDLFTELQQRIAAISEPTPATPLALTAHLLAVGAGAFYDPKQDSNTNSIKASEWIQDQIRGLEEKNVIQGREDVIDLLTMMILQWDRNYNDPLNPNVEGGDSRPRDIATLGAGYQQYLNHSANKHNELGGVCDHFVAAACQIWNGLYPEQPCYMVNIPGPDSQHIYGAINNGDGTYTIFDQGSSERVAPGYRQTLTAEGNPISYPGNQQLFVPVATVAANGEGKIVAAPPSELMNFVRALTQPTTDEGRLFQGAIASGFTSVTLGRKKESEVTFRLGAGHGRLSRQNKSLPVYAIYASADSLKKYGRLTHQNLFSIFNTVAHVPPDFQPSKIHYFNDVRSVLGFENAGRWTYLIPLSQQLDLSLIAGATWTAGFQNAKPEKIVDPNTNAVTYQDQSTGYTGAGNLRAGAKIDFQADRPTSGPQVSGSVGVTVEGMPGLVITRLHGVDSFGDLFKKTNRKPGFDGMAITTTAQASVQFSKPAGPSGQGQQVIGASAGVSRSPLNLADSVDWRVGTTYSLTGGNLKFPLSIAANYQRNNSLFDDRKVAHFQASTWLRGKTTAVRPGFSFQPGLWLQHSQAGQQEGRFAAGVSVKASINRRSR